MKRVLAAAVIASFMAMAPDTGTAGVNVNVSLDAYLPAPPGVRVYIDAGRPYYIRDDRRVYMEKKPKHDRGRHRGHYKKDDDHGRKHGHGKKKHD